LDLAGSASNRPRALPTLNFWGVSLSSEQRRTQLHARDDFEHGLVPVLRPPEQPLTSAKGSYRGAPKRSAKKRAFRRWVRLGFVLLAMPFPCPCLAQSPGATDAGSPGHLQQLVTQQRWAEIIDELEPIPNKSADLAYTYGMALAQTGRLDEARTAFLAGQRTTPSDKRFPIELAGVAFKQKHPGLAARHLRTALRIDAMDPYANDFLGTVYFVQSNQEAALKYWNRMGKPYVANVRTDHDLRTRSTLVDRSLAFSPADELRLADYETSKARLAGLGVFPLPGIQLAVSGKLCSRPSAALPTRRSIPSTSTLAAAR
jgi:tetratricopeptide (TPR) repeat protein